MTPTKLLDEIISALAKHGPTLIIHLLLFVWLSVRVLDPAALPSVEAVWVPIADRIDSSLRAVGLSPERWYVLAALTIAYLVTFRWIRNLVTVLPLVRVPFPTWPTPQLLRFAVETLRMRPDLWRVSEAIHKHTERATRELQEPAHPSSYLASYDRVNTWYAYYGTLLLVLAAMAIWLAEGASYARSAARVRELVILISICCLGVRWKTMFELGRRQTALAYWGLNHLPGDANDERADPLTWRRGQLVEEQFHFERAAARHPARILDRVSHRWLPEKAAKKVSARLRHPPWLSPHQDWEILESEASMYRDEQQMPPKALRVDEFAARFEPLLECTGSGLFMLVPSSLGLAPAVRQGGASYCLGMRRHGEYLLPISLQADDTLEQARLYVNSRPEAPSFLIEIGEVPVEQLAQETFPADAEANWSEVAQLEFEPEVWTQIGERQRVLRGSLALEDGADLHPGSSYLLGARTELGTRVSAVFQCFRVVGAPKVLIAWRILKVAAAESAMPEVLPWWRPAAWNGLLRPVEDSGRGEQRG